MAKNLRDCYQIKVTLKGISPPIWRRLLLDSTIKLDKLHVVLQLAMGWSGGHLHAFVHHDEVYAELDPDFNDYLDETRIKLSGLLKQEKQKLRYDYDFGDGWEHEVLLEKILPFDIKQTLPYCTAGKRACPPEDCGGVWGYKELLQIIKDPQHEEYAEWMEWLPEGFDSEYFSIEEINYTLQNLRAK